MSSVEVGVSVPDKYGGGVLTFNCHPKTSVESMVLLVITNINMTRRGAGDAAFNLTSNQFCLKKASGSDADCCALKKTVLMADISKQHRVFLHLEEEVVGAPAKAEAFVLVKLGVGQEHGGGFITLKVHETTQVSFLKEQALAKIRSKRLNQVQNSATSAVLMSKNFIVGIARLDARQRAANSAAGDPPVTVHLKEDENAWDALRREEEVRGVRPAVDSLTPVGLVLVRKPHVVVKVSIPDEAGGGFLTLTCDVTTSVRELKERCLRKMKQKRLGLMEQTSMSSDLRPELFMLTNTTNEVSKDSTVMTRRGSLPDEQMLLSHVDGVSTAEVLMLQLQPLQPEDVFAARAVETNVHTQGRYLQSDAAGNVVLSQRNNRCNWNMAYFNPDTDRDGTHKHVCLVDAHGRFLVVDAKDRVFTQQGHSKAAVVEWVVEDQKFLRGVNGTYLCKDGNQVRCASKVDRTAWSFSESLFQGDLKLKTPSGKKGLAKAFGKNKSKPLYFVLAHDVLSYWKSHKKKLAGEHPLAAVSVVDVQRVVSEHGVDDDDDDDFASDTQSRSREESFSNENALNHNNQVASNANLSNNDTSNKPKALSKAGMAKAQRVLDVYLVRSQRLRLKAPTSDLCAAWVRNLNRRRREAQREARQNNSLVREGLGDQHGSRSRSVFAVLDTRHTDYIARRQEAAAPPSQARRSSMPNLFEVGEYHKVNTRLMCAPRRRSARRSSLNMEAISEAQAMSGTEFAADLDRPMPGMPVSHPSPRQKRRPANRLDGKAEGGKLTNLKAHDDQVSNALLAQQEAIRAVLHAKQDIVEMQPGMPDQPGMPFVVPQPRPRARSNPNIHLSPGLACEVGQNLSKDNIVTLSGVRFHML